MEVLGTRLAFRTGQDPVPVSIRDIFECTSDDTPNVDGVAVGDPVIVQRWFTGKITAVAAVGLTGETIGSRSNVASKLWCTLIQLAKKNHSQRINVFSAIEI
jgi:hypothetical protein